MRLIQWLAISVLLVLIVMVVGKNSEAEPAEEFWNGEVFQVLVSRESHAASCRACTGGMMDRASESR